MTEGAGCLFRSEKQDGKDDAGGKRGDVVAGKDKASGRERSEKQDGDAGKQGDDVVAGKGELFKRPRR